MRTGSLGNIDGGGFRSFDQISDFFFSLDLNTHILLGNAPLSKITVSIQCLLKRVLSTVCLGWRSHPLLFGLYWSVLLVNELVFSLLCSSLLVVF